MLFGKTIRPFERNDKMRDYLKKNAAVIIRIGITILLAFAVVAVLAVTLIFSQKNSTPQILGYSIYIMNGKNMEPAIPEKSAVFSKNGKLPEDAVGTIALCNIFDKKLTTVLRVAGVENIDGKIVYLMKSDVGEFDDIIRVPSEDVIGQAVSVSKGLGGVLSFASSRYGILVFIIFPCAVLLIYQLIQTLKKLSGKDEFAEAFEDIELPEYAISKEITPEPIIEKAFEAPIFKEEPPDEEPPQKVLIDDNGKAEYMRNAPTADIFALDKALSKNPRSEKLPPPVKKPSPVAKPTNGLSEVLESPSRKKSFEFSPNDEVSARRPSVSGVSGEKKIVSPEQLDPFIAPRPKKTSTNKTLEELMKMLDQEQDKLNKMK